jgi:hypothetical protein
VCAHLFAIYIACRSAQDTTILKAAAQHNQKQASIIVPEKPILCC